MLKFKVFWNFLQNVKIRKFIKCQKINMKSQHVRNSVLNLDLKDQNVNALDQTFKCNIKNLYDRIFMMLMTSFVDL